MSRKYHSRARAIFGVFMAVLFLITLSGCWELKEVDQRSFATIIGIDAGERGEIILSVQFPTLHKMAPLSIEGAAPTGKTFYTITVSGRTLQEAFGMLQTETYRWAVILQNKAVIIGDEAARKGLKPLMDWLFRYPKAPTRSLVFVAKGRTAREVLEFIPEGEIIPGLQLEMASHANSNSNRTYFIPIRMFQQKMIHRSKDPYASLIDIDTRQARYRIAGIAVFHGARLAGELEISETQRFGMLSGLLQNGDMTFDISTERNTQAAITLQSLKIDRKIQVFLRNGLPIFCIQLQLSGKTLELVGEGSLRPQRVARLEKILESKLRPDLEATVRKLQGLNADVIDFGEKLRVQRYEYWKRINWGEIYPKAKFQVRLRVKIIQDGTMR
ncbi:MAG TPA: Ger(x)C family spore germination protein [Bacillota bacterium]|nr:Ger(x)C family spore germination protein [Bacillota bacterium]